MTNENIRMKKKRAERKHIREKKKKMMNETFQPKTKRK